MARRQPDRPDAAPEEPRQLSVGRLALFLSASTVTQALLFSALAPMLPTFERTLALSKTQAGLLVAMFPVGQAIAALPVGLLASRVGVKRFTVGGLMALAAMTVALGVVQSYPALVICRLAQGTAAAVCFASGFAWLLDFAPRHRRGELIGVVWGANAGGNVLGPAIGGLAVLAGRTEVFSGMAAFAALLALVGTRLTGPRTRHDQPLAALRRAHASVTVLSALAIVAAGSVEFGTIFALAPLALDRAGWGPVGIAATFVVAASIGVFARPLVGRWADGRGLVGALRILLVATVLATLVVPLVTGRWLLGASVVCAVIVCGLLVGPAMALAAQSYEERGVALLLGFAFLSLTVGVGFFLGSAVGGALAHLAGDASAYVLGAFSCAFALGALGFHRRPVAKATA
jgi:DHA1 family solute carrier family 18 vesicular amine transporter 1/2